MTIDFKHHKVKDIQKLFNERYPFLKIEFLNPGGGLLPPHTSLQLAIPAHYPLKISIDGQNKIADVEQEFQRYFAVKVKILRMAGSAWIETSLTRDWTLSRQNEEGYLFSAQGTGRVNTEDSAA